MVVELEGIPVINFMIGRKVLGVEVEMEKSAARSDERPRIRDRHGVGAVLCVGWVMTDVRPIIRLRYSARCASCGAELPPKTVAHWNKEPKEATCRGCVERTPASPEAARTTPQKTPAK